MSTDISVALLRGINVGGKRRLPMKDLTAIFGECGAGEVRTYIQSGNVVFRAGDAEGVRERVEAAIQARFGFHSAIVLRSAAALAAVVAANPFAGDEEDPAKLHVVFLREPADEAWLATLDPQHAAPDRFAACGREIYLHTPGGLGRTKLHGSLFDPKRAVATVRNWRTTLKLLELTGG